MMIVTVAFFVLYRVQILCPNSVIKFLAFSFLFDSKNRCLCPF